MFGYVVPQKSELKVRELAHYNAYYCGLCKAIGNRSGQAGRMFLNFDCTFLAIVLEAIAGGADLKKARCGYKPFHKKKLMAVNTPMLQFAADVNIALAYYKLKDDWADERKIIALPAKEMLKSSIKKIEKLRPELISTISARLLELATFEKANCMEPDAPADAFARLMREIAHYAPIDDDRNKKAFSMLMFHIGRWIYLIDAWDDREKDKKSGAYNVFNLAEVDEKRARFMMYTSLNEAIHAYELMNISTNNEIIDNVLYDGCRMRIEFILGGKHEQPV